MKSGLMDGISAVIFDLDGSLVDSMGVWREIDVEYLGRFGLEVPEDLQRSIEGFSFSETALYFQKRFALPFDTETIQADWSRMAWGKYLTQVRLKPGVKEFLDACRREGILLGIATSNSRDLTEHVADVHGLRRYFSCIVTACEVGKGKPAPDIYLAVAAGLGVSPENCLVFEDILPGIQAGKSAGMRVCAVDDAYSRDQEGAKKECAHFFIRDYRELLCGQGVPEADGCVTMRGEPCETQS